METAEMQKGRNTWILTVKLDRLWEVLEDKVIFFRRQREKGQGQIVSISSNVLYGDSPPWSSRATRVRIPASLLC